MQTAKNTCTRPGIITLTMEALKLLCIFVINARKNWDLKMGQSILFLNVINVKGICLKPTTSGLKRGKLQKKLTFASSVSIMLRFNLVLRCNLNNHILQNSIDGSSHLLPSFSINSWASFGPHDPGLYK